LHYIVNIKITTLLFLTQNYIFKSNRKIKERLFISGSYKYILKISATAVISTYKVHLRWVYKMWDRKE